MDIARARYLVSPAGRAALEALPPELSGMDPVRLATALRRTHPPEHAGALAEQITVLARGRARFGADWQMLLTAGGLEMMTHPAVSRRRAARLAALELPVADLTCGIGGDLSAIAGTGARLVGLDADRATAILAQANVPAAAVATGDAIVSPLRLEQFAVVVDPSRRSAAGRRFDPRAFSPAWDAALALVTAARAGVLKAPPGIDHGHLPPAAEVEFVQLGRSMREASVWVGAGTCPGIRRAVLLPSSATLDSEQPECEREPVGPGNILFDPESCVTRASLVRQLGARLEARLIDPQVAYLTADVAEFDPLCATFEVVEVVPFSLARLRARLRERGWKPVEVRRRAFPIEPDELLRLLGRLEGEPVTLLLTTVGGKRLAIVTRRLFPAG